MEIDELTALERREWESRRRALETPTAGNLSEARYDELATYRAELGDDVDD